MHPDFGTLVAHQDGELKPRLKRKVELHLSKCARCRRQLDQLSEEFRWLQALETGVSHPAPELMLDLQKILAGIRRWKHAPGEASRPATELSSRMAEYLAVYFGSGALGMLRSSEKGESQAEILLTSAEPLLSAFLGRSAAASLTSEALQQIALERGLAPELLG